MIRINQSYSSLQRKWIAIFCIAVLLLPIFAGAVYATPDADTGADNSLPLWNGGSAEKFGGGKGTQNDPYKISTGEELSLLAQNVRSGDDFAGKYFKLTADIRLNDISDFDSWSENAPARHWIPIGGYAPLHIGSAEDYDRATEESGKLLIRTEEGYTASSGYQSGVIYYRLTAFSGIFDGDGHTISGLYATDNSDYAGLFGFCKNATLKNLHLSYLYLDGKNRIGGLAGALLASDTLTVSNCKISGTVSGNDTVGGLFGYAEAEPQATLTINTCSFSGRLSGNASVGGILGASGQKNGTLQLLNCHNEGQISANTFAGGIVGCLSGNNDQISACKNGGSLWGKSQIGGIVGKIEPDSGIITVSDSLNSGTALADDSLGGIVGQILLDGTSTTLELLSCRNVGDLFGATAVGGGIGSCQISGMDNAVNLADSKNSVSIRGKTQIGGIIGNAEVNAGTLSVGTSENYGAIYAADNAAGGIIGAALSSSTLHLYECSVRATINVGNSYSGGIGGIMIAQNGNLLVERCAVGGTVKAEQSSDSVVGCIAGKLSSISAEATAQIRNCLGNAILSAKSAAGGIVGHLTATEGKSLIESSLFSGGIVTGCKVTGGIAATALAEQESALVRIADCYYGQGSSTRAMLPGGGKGSESCLATESLADADLRNPEKLGGLDFSVWEAPEDGSHYPTPGSIPFVWEEYQYTVTQDGAMLDAYLGRSDVVVIPDQLGGIAVTTISDQAFWHSDVIRVTMPDSISAIGEAAFAGCASLERVTLSAGLVSIGARAFYGCDSLSQLRCTESLSTLVVGGENEAYKALSLTHPVPLQVVHNYEDGGNAGKNTSLTCYVGDYYEITPLKITGYEADTSMLSGICYGTDRVSVIYRIGSYRLTIRYLYPDGSEAFPTYEKSYHYGEAYSISTPQLDGYSADRALIDGTMPGEDLQLTIYFSQIYTSQTESAISSFEIALLILSGLTTVCCLAYFIYRYRSSAEVQRKDQRF